MMEEISTDLVRFLTKFTDYVADRKIMSKDLAIQVEFLEPLKWHFIEDSRTELRNGAALLANCYKSEHFWAGLTSAHRELIAKYPGE